MVINVSVPSMNGLDESTKIKHIEKYLYELNDQLRYILSNLEIDNFSVETADALNISTQAKRRAEKDFKKEIDSVRQKIKKTAEEVEAQIETVRTEMQGQATYVSSQFGTIEETYIKQNDENALGETTLYKTVANINGYVTSSMNYIRTGLLDEDPLNGEYGVEIGDIAGHSGGLKLRLVKNRVGFYENGAEVAYINNKELCITQARIKLYIFFGGYKANVTNGIAFDWDGDDDE
jgi:hypothetical protein